MSNPTVTAAFREAWARISTREYSSKEPFPTAEGLLLELFGAGVEVGLAARKETDEEEWRRIKKLFAVFMVNTAKVVSVMERMGVDDADVREIKAMLKECDRVYADGEALEAAHVHHWMDEPQAERCAKCGAWRGEWKP